MDNTARAAHARYLAELIPATAPRPAADAPAAAYNRPAWLAERPREDAAQARRDAAWWHGLRMAEDARRAADAYRAQARAAGPADDVAHLDATA